MKLLLILLAVLVCTELATACPKKDCPPTNCPKQFKIVCEEPENGPINSNGRYCGCCPKCLSEDD